MTELLGVDAIKAALKTIPPAPGCYQMIDATGRILYVGKAKHLANRVTSYTNITALNNRILSMVNKVARVEIVLAQNEAEAFLLEASLIKKHQPRYNVLLKDDKSFPYIHIDTTHPFPRIEKYRGSQNKPGEYFGPFANVLALNQAMALLQKIFLLRPCSDAIFANRSRPCLQYQIKRCTAPCVGYVSTADYGAQLARARAFLKGKSREVQDDLTHEMNAASAAMDYEKAAHVRDRIRALTTVQQEQGLRIAGLHDADVIALARRGDKSAVTVSFYRNGSAFGTQNFYPRHSNEESDSEILLGFLGQFYEAHLPPGEVLMGIAGGVEIGDVEILAQALSTRAGHRVEIRTPERGDKKNLVEQVAKTAATALERQMMERASIESHLLRVKELFTLPRMPSRIEVYDNSHISGTNAVGAFIVATPEGFDKKSYRTFTIKTAAGDDDFAMMREVMRRRFKKVSSRQSPVASKKDSLLETGDWRLETALPDLLLIDGGIGQLHAVEEVLTELGVEGPALVAIAKGEDRNAGREWFHQPGRAPFQLPVNDSTLQYLQRLRDEVHRFAIGRHRNKRSKSFTRSALDDIPGIGPTRKRALLQHFGSRADVETASLEELMNVKGINKATAQAVYDYFHG